MTEIYIIRHGETDFNLRGTLQGTLDAPLNATGIRQAREAAAFVRGRGLTFDRVYATPLSRTQDTAAAVSGFRKEDMIIDPRIIEFDYGDYDGKRNGDLKPDMLAFLADPDHVAPPEGVETIQSLIARTRAFLEDLAEELTRADAAGDPPARILIATHGVAFRGLLAGIQRLPVPGDAIWHLGLGNCEIYRTTFRDGWFEKAVQWFAGATPSGETSGAM